MKRKIKLGKPKRASGKTPKRENRSAFRNSAISNSASGKRSEFLELLSRPVKGRQKSFPEIRFFESASELLSMIPINSPLAVKLEGKFFANYFEDRNSAYAVRTYRKGKLEAFLVFLGKSAPKKEIEKLAAEITGFGKTGNKSIKTAAKVELQAKK